ncbi:F-box only protein 42 [Entomophthora muscae]|uniref:F-box only protein 42 n=1 Tax=Entomophthora muscae TaxID=34485 RepID=A0ACC2T6G4_9FUNG|nr:F-box only protein 42 [Entomophthora muscae]
MVSNYKIISAKLMHILHLRIPKYFIWYHLLLSVTNAEDNPNYPIGIRNVVGGDCVISGQTLYYLGGRRIKPEVANRTAMNKLRRRQNFDAFLDLDKVDSTRILSRRLDLGSSFGLDDADQAPWEDLKTNSSFEQISPMFPQVVASTGSRADIFIFGGAGAKAGQEFVNFDPSSYNFFVDQESATYVMPQQMEGTEDVTSMSAPAHGTLVQSDLYPNQYLQFGGVSLRDGKGNSESLSNVALLGNNGAFSDGRVLRYLAKEKIWQQDSLEDGQLSFLHSATVVEGKMYVLGGVHPYSLRPYSWNSVRVYDINDRVWKILHVKGPFPQPRYGHRAVMVDSQTLAIVGGAGGAQTGAGNRTLNFDSRILLLNLKDLTWHSVSPEGWKGSYMGCATIYNSQLIYAFGQTEDSSGLGRTYVIDTKTWTRSKIYMPPSTASAVGSLVNNTFKISVIAVGAMGAVLLSILLALFFRARAKLSRSQHSIDSPPIQNISNDKITPQKPSQHSYFNSQQPPQVSCLKPQTLPTTCSLKQPADAPSPQSSSDSFQPERAPPRLTPLDIGHIPIEPSSSQNSLETKVTIQSKASDQSTPLPASEQSSRLLRLSPNLSSDSRFAVASVTNTSYELSASPISPYSSLPHSPTNSGEPNHTAASDLTNHIQPQSMNRTNANSTPDYGFKARPPTAAKSRRMTTSDMDKVVQASKKQLLATSSINIGIVVGHKVAIQSETIMPLSTLDGDPPRVERHFTKELDLHHHSNPSTVPCSLISPSNIDLPSDQSRRPILLTTSTSFEISSLGSSANTINLSPLSTNH